MTPARPPARAQRTDAVDVEVHADPGSIDPTAWNRLVDERASATPFMRHEYLVALHASRSAVAAGGGQPQFLTVAREGELVAACPMYLKDHSYGEYVFDWAWADAYRRHGLQYYPKLVDAVPFTPVPGPRLLALRKEHRGMLLRGIQQLAE